MDTGQKYLVRDAEGNVYGPADAAMLRQWVADGRIIAGMHIAPQGSDAWTEASQHPAVADLLSDAPAVAEEPAREAPNPYAAATLPVKPVEPTRVQVRPVGLNYQTPAQRRNALALWSFICGCAAPLCGIVGLVGGALVVLPCCCVPVSGLSAVAAIVLGGIGFWQCRANPQRYNGKGLAITGMILGILTLLLAVAVLVAAIIWAAAHPGAGGPGGPGAPFP